jgi:hypothetical protein
MSARRLTTGPRNFRAKEPHATSPIAQALLEEAMTDEALLLTELGCRVCGNALSLSDADVYQTPADDPRGRGAYCSEHIPSHLSVCLECSGVYTANPGGVCQYCLAAADD